METKPGAVLSHSVPSDGENIITSIAWNVRFSLSTHKNAGTSLVTASYDGEVKCWNEGSTSALTVCHQKAPVFNVSFSPSDTRLLVTGSLPSFYVYRLGSEGISQVPPFSFRNRQEFDTLAINDAEKQLGSTTTLNSNSRRVFVSTRSGSSRKRVARRRQFLLHRQPESHRERESPLGESATPHPDSDGTRSRRGGGVSDRER